MAYDSKIEWTMPLGTGTGMHKISPAAFTVTLKHLQKGACIKHPYERGFDLRVVPINLPSPYDGTLPNDFVNSMSDLFHHKVPMNTSSQLQVMCQPTGYLSGSDKRSERMRDLLKASLSLHLKESHLWECLWKSEAWPPSNRSLRSSEAAVKFLSVSLCWKTWLITSRASLGYLERKWTWCRPIDRLGLFRFASMP